MAGLPMAARRPLALSLSLLVLAPAPFAFVRERRERPEYTIYRAATPIVVDGRLDEPAWTAAPDVGAFVFPWHKGGRQEQTVAKMLWDETHLYVAFICEDAHIWAVHTQRDSPVSRDDTVELFTAPNPDRPQAYFNFEMNAIAIFLDRFQPSGPGSRGDGEWNAEGVRAKTSIVGTLNDDRDEDSYLDPRSGHPLPQPRGGGEEHAAASGRRLAPEPESPRREHESATQPVVREPDASARLPRAGGFRARHLLGPGESLLAVRGWNKAENRFQIAAGASSRFSAHTE